MGCDWRLVHSSLVVVIEIISDIHSTSNWSSGEDFLLHLVLSDSATVFLGIPLSEVSSDWVANLTEVWSPLAVHTVLDWGAVSRGWVRGGVHLTSELSQVMLVTELVDSVEGTSLTGTSGSTVKDLLDRHGKSWESIVIHDVDSVSKGSKSGLSPTGTTVLRKMLVDSP